jgi:hypothetical protein
MTNRQFYDFVYDLAYIAAGKNFTMGGFFNMNERRIIIRKRNIPSTVTIKLKDHLEFSGERWEINEINSFYDSRSALILVVSKVGGSEVAA